MVESWPHVMGELGAPKKKHWWTELWERGLTDEEGEEKTVVQET